MDRNEMNKKLNERVYQLMLEETLLDTIDSLVDDMIEYPDAQAIFKRIKAVSGKYD